MSLLDTYLANNKSGNYTLGAMFLDCLKRKRPHDIFQEKECSNCNSIAKIPETVNKDIPLSVEIDAATGEEETNTSVLSRYIRLAKCFRNIGLKPGDVLALGGKNHLDLHIPYYAAIMNGYPVAGVDPYFKYDEIRNLFKLTAPKIAFCQQENAEDYAKAAKDLGLDLKIVTFDGDGSLAKFMEENEDKHDNSEYQPAVFDINKIYAWLITTSGTTGLPKVAAFRHDVIINQIIGYTKMQAQSDSINDKRKLGFNLSPVQWISAFYNAVGMPLMNRIKLQTSTADNTEHVIDVINKYKPVHVMTHPFMLAQILNHEKHCDLSCFDMLTITGSKVHKDLALAIKARLRPNAVLMDTYGQTETLGPALMPNPQGPIGNCGVPLPSSVREVKLVDPDTGNEVTEPNVPGELWTRGPSFAEYYNSPAETAKAFTEDGWYKTGDLLYRDEENNYYFVDRLKMLMKYRNYHVNPNELEEVIMKLEGVLEVSVIGIPHPDDGQHAAACVVRRPGFEVTAQQVKDIVSENLSASKQLRGGVIFLDALPKTSTGKVARAKLGTLVATLNRE